MFMALNEKKGFVNTLTQAVRFLYTFSGLLGFIK